ncbi:molecular chaperone [Kalamiella sp. sgz302252]|uniref:fimbrial biogenesis chaperone n=1 Tax=Pantoea sp. sgz302252 TaxID=3341827 RepID=UPI0036D28CB1
MRLFNCAILAPCLAILFSSAGYANGLALGATRLIYLQGKNEASVPLNNRGDSVPYLVQAWVTDFSQSQNKTPFITTPPLFKLDSNSAGAVRVVYTGGGANGLANDRESLFLLNVRAVPATPKAGPTNRLIIATQNIIKLIYRPASLTSQSAGDAWKKLRLTPSVGSLTFNNPTPYVVTLTRMKVNGQPLERPGTLMPFSSRTITTPAGKIASVTFSTINDFGGSTPERNERF